MTTIWKYPIKTTDFQTIEMPEGAVILTVQMQLGTPQLWAMVDTDRPLTKRFIETFGTNHKMENNDKTFRDYIGSYQLRNGELVFHVFEYVRL